VDAPKWTEVELDLPNTHRPIVMAFRGTALEIVATNSKLMTWNEGHVWEQLSIDGFTFRPMEAGIGLMLVPSSNGKLYYFDELSQGEIVLPSAMPRLKLATRPGHSRVVAISDGIVNVFDLEAIVPRALPHTGNFDIAWVSDDTILFYPASDQMWRWYDLSTGKTIEFKTEARGFPMMEAISFGDGRVLIKDVISAQGDHDVSRMLLYKKGSTTARVFATATDAFGTLTPGDGLVYSPGDNRVMGSIGVHRRELVKLDSGCEHRGARLPLRGDQRQRRAGARRAAHDDIERTHVAFPHSARLEGDATGTPLIFSAIAAAGTPTFRRSPVRQTDRTRMADRGGSSCCSSITRLFVESRPHATPHRLLLPRSPSRGSAATRHGGRDRWRGPDQHRRAPSMTRYTYPACSGRACSSPSPRARARSHKPSAPSSRCGRSQTPPRSRGMARRAHERERDDDGVMIWPWQLGGRSSKRP
jgi:hypothetical protein